MHLADLTAYLEADRQLLELYADPEAWTRKVILNIASSGKFSSDRTIAEYASRDLGREALPGTVERSRLRQCTESLPDARQGCRIGLSIPSSRAKPRKGGAGEGPLLVLR